MYYIRIVYCATRLDMQFRSEAFAIVWKRFSNDTLAKKNNKTFKHIPP